LWKITDEDASNTPMARGQSRGILVHMQVKPARVMIVGGGVAALEAMIALRQLAQERVEIELVAPRADWSYRPMIVAEPFGAGEAKRYDLVRIARDHGAVLHLAGVQAVEPDAHRVVTWDGRRLSYDLLVIAVGGIPVVTLPGSLSIGSSGYSARFRSLLRQLEARRIRRLAFAVPSTVSWPLPVYELALMTAAHAAKLSLSDIKLSVVTPEREPCELFTPPASAAIAGLLEEHCIAFYGGRHPAEVRHGELITVPGVPLPTDSVVSLPQERGPSLAGLPHDPLGFIPTDLHGLVHGQEDVYAAGDATTYPIKQGGIAAQQAAAAAEAIAARVGAPLEPRAFRPVIRGLLLTGGQPAFVRTEVSGRADQPPEAAVQPLWWPPSKIATRWLAPYLALKHDELEAPPNGMAVELEVGAAEGLAGKAL
jgi:sulfide:quinone oxidoreductase